jgi:hypothetical protein
VKEKVIEREEGREGGGRAGGRKRETHTEEVYVRERDG